jgi:hypothetical protein
MFHLSEQQKDLHNVTYDDVVIPCSQTKELSFLANSWDDTHINFDCKFSRNDLIDREVFIEYEVSLTMKSSDVDEIILLAVSEYCISQNPLSRVTDKNRVVINGSCVSEIENNFRAPLSLYQTPTSTIELPDVVNNVFAQSRVESVEVLKSTGNPNIDDWQYNHMLANSHFRNSPMSQNGNLTRGNIQPKAIRYFKSLAANPVTDCVELVYRVVEKVFNPSLTTNNEKYSVLANVENMTVEFKLNSLLAMFQTGVIVSDNAAGFVYHTPFGESVKIQKANNGVSYTPKLLFKCYVPSVPIPRNFTSRYVKYNKLTFPILKKITEATNIDANEVGYIKTKPISLSQVPNAIYLYVRPTSNYYDTVSAESYGVIDSLKFITTCDSGVFSNCDQYQLYSMCKRNGLNVSFEDFSDMTGSVIKIDMEKSDISGFVAGEVKPFQFEVECEFTNKCFSGYNYNDLTFGTMQREEDFEAPIYWSLNMIFEYEGRISITNTSADIGYGISSNYIARVLKKNFT